MPKGRLEHANISVTNLERSAALLINMLGWKERWRGSSLKYGPAVHIGGDDNYIALYIRDHATGDYVKGMPLNHLAFVVDDLDSAQAVVEKHGLEPFNRGKYDPGPESFYFFDWDGIEFEVVCYE